ncbi:MAG: oligosaccharide flippase family protein, partial [Gemmatimonadaceae bacterium]|nr:oligosaccharide flippase family protein [Gemmatimonadaceae bacterium]
MTPIVAPGEPVDVNGSSTALTDPNGDVSADPVSLRRKKKKQYYAKTAKRGALWSIVKQGGHEIFAIPISMIMARLLSPEEFGIAAASALFIRLSTRLTQFGFNASLVRIKVLRPEHLSSVFVVNLMFGVLTYLALVAAAPAVGTFLRSPEAGELLAFAALIFLINPFGTVPASLMSRNMQFRNSTITDWSDMVVSLSVTLVLAFRGFGYWSIVTGHLSGAVVRVILKAYLSSWRPSLAFSRQATRELLGFG